MEAQLTASAKRASLYGCPAQVTAAPGHRSANSGESGTGILQLSPSGIPDSQRPQLGPRVTVTQLSLFNVVEFEKYQMSSSGSRVS